MHKAKGKRFNQKVCVVMSLLALAAASHAAEGSLDASYSSTPYADQIVFEEAKSVEPSPQISKYTETKPVTSRSLAELAVESEVQSVTPEDKAAAAAVADGLTTVMALSAGAVEMNPIITATPAGVIAVTGLKYGLVKYAESFPEEEKRTVMKSAAALWGGAAVNNLLVLLAAPSPLSIVAGVVAGIATWQHMQSEYEKKDELIAARERMKATMQASAEPVVAQQFDSSGQ